MKTLAILASILTAGVGAHMFVQAQEAWWWGYYGFVAADVALVAVCWGTAAVLLGAALRRAR